MELLEKQIREAYIFLREKNMTIPSDTLQFMLDASLEKLKNIETKDSEVVDYNSLFIEKYNEEPSVGSCYPSFFEAEAVYTGNEWKTLH
jgi:hypothetical protein